MDEQVLAQLRDVHLPPEPSWWPLAWGYWLIIFLLIFLLLGALLVKKYFRKNIKKQIYLELARLEQSFRASAQHSFLQNEISGLLKRIVKARGIFDNHRDLRSQLLSLSKNHELTTEICNLLEHDRFRKEVSFDGMRLIACTKEFVKKCRL